MISSSLLDLKNHLLTTFSPEFCGQGDYYKLDTVPPILGHLNLQRERFRDDFKVYLVFLVPLFGLKYLVRRSPDFYDWRSGVFDFPLDQEFVEQESSRIIAEADYNQYLQLNQYERYEKILQIKDLITETQLTDAKKAELGRAIASFDKTVEIKPDDGVK